MQAPRLARQCADPQTFFQTHYESDIPIPTDMTVHQYFSRLALSYSFFIKRNGARVCSHTKQSTALMLRTLNIPCDDHEAQRQQLGMEAKHLNDEALKPSVHQGAAVADMISTVYGYIARCAAKRLQDRGELALTCSPNNAEAMDMVEDDLANPNMSLRMLERIEDVNPTALDEVRRLDLDKLREHLTLWQKSTDLQIRVSAFVEKLRTNILQLSI